MKLKKWLRENKVSQKRFAELLNIPAITVFRLANGRSIPSIKVMHEIIRITGGSVQPNDFYSEI